jgi:diguanylate cyclase
MQDTDVERSFAVANRALELMKAYGSSASPRSYEVWFTYVSGHKPLMNDAIKRLTADGALADADIDGFTTPSRPIALPGEAERTGATMIAEIDQVVEMIELRSAPPASTAPRWKPSPTTFPAPWTAGAFARSANDGGGDAGGVGHQPHAGSASQGNAGRDRDPARSAGSGAGRVAHRPADGIATASTFEERLTKGDRAAAGKGTPLALAVIDVDHFKRFNDRYGHLTGDQVLRLVSVTMREHVTPARRSPASAARSSP